MVDDRFRETDVSRRLFSNFNPGGGVGRRGGGGGGGKEGSEARGGRFCRIITRLFDIKKESGEGDRAPSTDSQSSDEDPFKLKL